MAPEQHEMAVVEAFSKMIAATKEAEAQHELDKLEWEETWVNLQNDLGDTSERVSTLEAELALAKEVATEAQQSTKALEEAKSNLEAEKEWLGSMLRAQQLQAAASNEARDVSEQERNHWKEQAERSKVSSDNLSKELNREQQRVAALLAEKCALEEALAVQMGKEEALRNVEKELTEERWQLAGEVRELRQQMEQHSAEREEWQWAQANLEGHITTELGAAKAVAIEAVAQRDSVVQQLGDVEAGFAERSSQMLVEITRAKEEFLQELAQQKATEAAMGSDLMAALRHVEEAEAAKTALQQAQTAVVARNERLQEEFTQAEASFRSQLLQMESALQAERQHLGEVEGRLAQLQTQVTKERKEWEQAEEVLYQDLAELRSAARDAERKLEEEKAELQGELDIHLASIAELRAAVSALRAELQAERNVQAGLEAELKLAGDTAERLRKTAETMAVQHERDRARWAEATDDLQSTMDSMRSQFEEKLSALKAAAKETATQLEQVTTQWKESQVKFEGEVQHERAMTSEARALHEGEAAQWRRAEADLQAEFITMVEELQAERVKAATLQAGWEAEKAGWAQTRDRHEQHQGESDVALTALEAERTSLKAALEEVNEKLTETEFKLRQMEAKNRKDMEHQRAMSSDIRVRLTAEKDELELELARLSNDLGQQKAEAAEAQKRFTREKADLDDTVAELQQDVLHFAAKVERQRKVIAKLLLTVETEKETAATARAALEDGRREWEDSREKLMKDVTELNTLAEKVIMQRQQVTEGWWQAEAELTAELAHQKAVATQEASQHAEQQEAWRKLQASLRDDLSSAAAQVVALEAQLEEEKSAAAEAEEAHLRRQQELDHMVEALTTDLASKTDELRVTSHAAAALRDTLTREQEAAAEALEQHGQQQRAWQQREAALEAEAARLAHVLDDAQARGIALVTALAETRFLAEEAQGRHQVEQLCCEATETSVAALWSNTTASLGRAGEQMAMLQGELQQAREREAGLRGEVGERTAALHVEKERAVRLEEALACMKSAAAEAQVQQAELQAQVVELSTGLQAERQHATQLTEALTVETTAAAEARAKHMARCEEWTACKIELQAANASLSQELGMEREKMKALQEEAAQAKMETTATKAELRRVHNDAAQAKTVQLEADTTVQHEWQRIAEAKARLVQEEAHGQELLSKRDEELRQHRQEMAAAAVMSALKESDHVEAIQKLLTEATSSRRHIQELLKQLKHQATLEAVIQQGAVETTHLKCSLALQKKELEQLKSDNEAARMALGFLRCIDNAQLHQGGPEVNFPPAILPEQASALSPVLFAGVCERVDVFQAVKQACHRPHLLERCRAAGQPIPPTTAWLLREMEREWCPIRGTPAGRVLWQQAVQSADESAKAWGGKDNSTDPGGVEGLAASTGLHPSAPETVAGLLSRAEAVALCLSAGIAHQLLDHTLCINSGRFAATQWALDCAIGKLAARQPPPSAAQRWCCPLPPSTTAPRPADEGPSPQLLFAPMCITAGDDAPEPGGGEALASLVMESLELEGFACVGAEVVRGEAATPEYLLPSGTLLLPVPPAELLDGGPQAQAFRPYFAWDPNHQCPVMGDEAVWMRLAASLWRHLAGGEDGFEAEQALAAMGEHHRATLPDGLDAVPDWGEWLLGKSNVPSGAAAALHRLQGEEADERQRLVSAMSTESAALVSVACALHHFEAVHKRMMAAQEVWRTVERQRQSLVRRELEVQRCEEMLKVNRRFAENERDGWLSDLHEHKVQVDALHFDTASKMRELAIVLAKERVLERLRLQNTPQGSALAALEAARPLSSRGQRDRPKSPETDAVMLRIWNSEHQLQQLNEQLHNCVLKLKRFHQQVMQIFDDSCGGAVAATAEDPFALFGGRLEGMAANDVAKVMQRMGELGELNALYREGHEVLEAMSAVITSAKLSLTPHQPRGTDLAASWPPRRSTFHSKLNPLSPTPRRAATRPTSASSPLWPLNTRGGLHSKASMRAFLQEAYGL